MGLVGLFRGISDFVRDLMDLFMGFFRRDGIFGGDDTVFVFFEKGDSRDFVGFRWDFMGNSWDFLA